MIFDFIGIMCLLFVSAFGFNSVTRAYFVVHNEMIDLSLVAWGILFLCLVGSAWRAKRGKPFLFYFMLVWVLVALAFEWCFLYIFTGDEQSGVYLRWLLACEAVGVIGLAAFRRWKLVMLSGAGSVLSLASPFLLFPLVFPVSYFLWAMCAMGAWWLVCLAVKNEKLNSVLRGLGVTVAILGFFFGAVVIYQRLPGIRFYESKIREPAKEIKLSIIVPVYNAESAIERCLDSLRRQSLKDIEIIVVDDGSTDRTPEILARYAAHDARIRVIRQENAYVGAARNHGLREARGEYVGFVDSDDYVSKDFYEVLYQTALKDKAEVVLTKEIQVTRQLKPWYLPEKLSQMVFSAKDKEGFFRQDKALGVAYVWNKIYKKEFLLNNDIWFTTYRTLYEDSWFSFLIKMYATDLSVANGGRYYYSKGEQPTVSTIDEARQEKLPNDEVMVMFVAFEEKIKNAGFDGARTEFFLQGWRRKMFVHLRNYYWLLGDEDKLLFVEKCKAFLDEEVCVAAQQKEEGE